MLETIVFIAFLWGAFSAVSLPLGAVTGLAWKPNQKTNSAFMAFGAGALLFALTIELFGHIPHHVGKHGYPVLIAVVIGALLGGAFFDLLNNILNNQGAYIRKLSSAKRQVVRLRLKKARHILESLGKIKALRKISPDKMADLIKMVDEVKIDEGQPVFMQGDSANEMYFIVSGVVDIVIHESQGEEKKVASLLAGDTFGEIGILKDVPRTADAIASKNCMLYKLSKEDFDIISANAPLLIEEMQKLADHRLSELSGVEYEDEDEDWDKKIMEFLHQHNTSITVDDIKNETGVGEGKISPVAIWLGILIDGIPESLIIGMLAISTEGMSLAFIAGVFLANFPEAMSSAVSMQNYGMKYKKILWMWMSLCIMTGVGAGIGALFFPAEPTGGLFLFVIGIEGLAAGAMLTMIAETMLPEAFEQGGTIVGIATLLGFLSALVVKIVS